MVRLVSRTLATEFFALLLLSTASEAAVPVPVSPGGTSGGAVADRCPTFSWGAAEQVEGYELVVYEVEGDGEGAGPSGEPAIRASVPGSARSWPPGLESCLRGGASYTWAVRAVRADGLTGPWSDLRLFEVARPSMDLDRALEVVRRHLGPEVASGLERFAAEPGAKSSDGERAEERSVRPGTTSGAARVGALAETGPLLGEPALARSSGSVETSSTPSLALDVDGAARAGAFRYGSSQVRTHPVPGVAFRPLNGTHDVGYSGEGFSYLRSGSSYTALAEVHLPDQAVLDTFTCHAHDNDDSNSGIWNYELGSRSFDQTGNFTSIATVRIDTAGSSSTVSTGTDTTPASSVDNDLSQYWINLTYDRDFGSSNTLDLRNYGCEIEYLVQEVSTP